MKKEAIRFLVGLVCLSAAIAGVLTATMTAGLVPGASRFAGLGTAKFLAWTMCLDRVTNSYFPWHPLIPVTGTLVSAPTILFLVGGVLPFSFSLLEAAVAAVLVISVICLSASDPITLQAVMTVPLAYRLIAVALGSRRPQMRCLATVLAGLLLSLCANQLGLPLALLVVSAAAAGETISASSGHILVWFCVVASISGWIAPTINYPLYPQGGAVVPDDEIPGMMRPFFGPTPPIPIMNHFATKWFAFPLALGLALWVTLVFIPAIFRSRTTASINWPRVRAVLLFWAMAVGIQVLLPEQVSTVGPLAVLRRLSPTLFPFELAVPIGTAALLLGGVCALRAGRNVSAATLPAILWLAIAISPFLAGWVAPDSETHLGTARLGAAVPLVAQLSSIQAAAAATTNTAALQLTRETLLNSPSFFLFRETPPSLLLDRRAIIQYARFRRLRANEAQLVASQNIELLPQLNSSEPDRRWMSGGALQTGTEWLEIRLNVPQYLDGIELNVGPFVTDFPRGVRISSLATCEPNLARANREDYRTVIDFPQWRGAIEFTSDGFPFHRDRSDVKIYFPETIAAQCLRIQQTGRSFTTDWSIAQINLLDAAAGAF